MPKDPRLLDEYNQLQSRLDEVIKTWDKPKAEPRNPANPTKKLTALDQVLGTVQERHSKKKHRDNLRNYTNQLTRRGQLVRGPCNTCGAEPTLWFHTDWEDPRHVIPLCKKHHRDESDKVFAREMKGVYWQKRKSSNKKVNKPRPYYNF